MKSERYDDIINLPWTGSKSLSRMPMEERAAQFAPFAALTGFGEVISAAAREHVINGENEITLIPEDGL